MASGSLCAGSAALRRLRIGPGCVLDSGGNLPSTARFSTENDFTGGYHPMGMVGLWRDAAEDRAYGLAFDDPQKIPELCIGLCREAAAERKGK